LLLSARGGARAIGAGRRAVKRHHRYRAVPNPLIFFQQSANHQGGGQQNKA